MKRELCVLGALCLLLTACAGPEIMETTEPTAAEAATVETEYIPEPLEILAHREGELVFSMTAEAFISGFNSNWGGEYLTPAEEWKEYRVDAAIHSPHETLCRRFSENEKVWSPPTITVYTPTDSDRIQQITVNFDEHSRTEELYELYGELCRTALETFLPECDGAALSQKINELAYENVFESEDSYSADSLIPVIYHRDGVGVYPYFALGQWVNFVIIPVDDARLNELQAEGTEIIEIE